jgi:hypothetical protein
MDDARISVKQKLTGTLHVTTPSTGNSVVNIKIKRLKYWHLVDFIQLHIQHATYAAMKREKKVWQRNQDKISSNKLNG